MIVFQQLSALWVVLGLIATSVVVIAAFVKSSQEQRKAQNENWKLAWDAMDAHVKALEMRLKDGEQLQGEMRQQVADLNAALTQAEKKAVTAEREKGQLTSRNIRLYDLCQDLRAKINRLGGDPGPDPNGDE